MRRFRSSSQVKSCAGEVIKGKSLTVPDLAPSMRELLKRHQMGLVDNVSQTVSYSGDMPDLRGYEPHQVTTMIDEMRSKIRSLEELKNEQIVNLRQVQYDNKRKRDLELLAELQKQE